MNELKTTGLGGLPIALDDIRFVYDAIKQALNGLSNALSLTNVDGIGNPHPVKLWGCTITADIVSAAPLVKYSVSEGFISMGGEIFYVPSTFILANSGDTIYFVISESYDSAGELTFADQSVQNIYKIRNATISASNAGSAYYCAISDMITFIDLIKLSALPVWINVQLVPISNVSGTVSLGYDGSNCFLKFDLITTAATTLTSGIIANWLTVGWGNYVGLKSSFLNRCFPLVIEKQVPTNPLLGWFKIHETTNTDSTIIFIKHADSTDWTEELPASTRFRGVFQTTFNS